METPIFPSKFHHIKFVAGFLKYFIRKWYYTHTIEKENNSQKFTLKIAYLLLKPHRDNMNFENFSFYVSIVLTAEHDIKIPLFSSQAHEINCVSSFLRLFALNRLHIHSQCKYNKQTYTDTHIYTCTFRPLNCIKSVNGLLGAKKFSNARKLIAHFTLAIPK